MKIPKIIYYVWLNNNPIPEEYQNNIDGWKKLMPNYKYVEINLSNYPHSRFVDNAVELKEWVHACDYLRSQILYETGGIYIDVDFELLKPLDDFLDDKLFMGINDKNGEINNAIMGSIAKHTFLKKCIDYMDKFSYSDIKQIHPIGGPVMVTQLMENMGWKRIDKTQKYNDISLYNSNYFYPYSWYESYDAKLIHANTYGIHKWAATWLDKVSIIIPCHNYSRYLYDAIESALDQTLKSIIEVIVVNYGSTDHTSDVAKSYPVKLIETENNGVSAARNAGALEATGKWLIFLDADDKLSPKFIAECLTQNTNDIIATLSQHFGDECKVYGDSNNQYNNISSFLKFNSCITGAMHKKEIWEDIGGFDETLRDGYEDWDYWIRALIAGYKMITVNKPLFLYRVHKQSMMRTICKGKHGILSKTIIYDKYLKYTDEYQTYLKLLDVNRLKNGHIRKKLDNVTAVIVDCKNKDGILNAVSIMNYYLDVPIKIFTTLDIPDSIQINPIRDKGDYSTFIVNELYRYIETDYCLIFQVDGFVLNPLGWSDEFLNYDYVGSPSKGIGGRGEFSLRSKKLMEYIANITLTKVEDEYEYICKYYGRYLEADGFRFAPYEVARKFSVENDYWSGQFGFHGLNTDLRKWFIERGNIELSNETIKF